MCELWRAYGELEKLNFGDASCKVSVFVWISRGVNCMHRIPQSVKIGENCNVKRRLDKKEKSAEITTYKVWRKISKENQIQVLSWIQKGAETFPKVWTSKPYPILPCRSEGREARQGAVTLVRVVWIVWTRKNSDSRMLRRDESEDWETVSGCQMPCHHHFKKSDCGVKVK